MKKINNNGFTLVEVLVTITIMGLISILALPEVQQLQAKNRLQKFITYGDTLKDSAKLYVDSNSPDLFGYATTGCADIPFSELKAKTLAKDYLTGGITCDNNQTYVHVVRKNGVDTYKVFLKCVSSSGKVEYQTENLEVCPGGTSPGGGGSGGGETPGGGGSGGGETPGGGGGSGGSGGGGTVVIGTGNFTISISPEDGSTWKRNRKATIKVTSDDGFAANTVVSYYLATDAAGNNQVAGTSGAISFGNSAGTKQMERTVILQGVTGRLYLIAKPIRMVDINGNSYTDNVASGELLFDNDPPKLKSVVEVKREDALTVLQLYTETNKHLMIDFEENGSGIVKWSYTYPDGDGEEKDYYFSIGPILSAWCQKDTSTSNLWPTNGVCNNEYHYFFTSAFKKSTSAEGKRVILKAYDAVGNVGTIETTIVVD